MFFPSTGLEGLFFIFPMVLLAGIFIVLMIVLVAVIGRRTPDVLGRRAEAAYLYSATFAIGLGGLAALGLTADAIGQSITGTERCAITIETREGELVPRPGLSLIPRPEFSIPDFGEFFPPEFRFTPEPQASIEPAAQQIRPQPVCFRSGRVAAARGIRGAIYLGVAAIGVVWFGNRARELLAKERPNDA